MATGDLATLWAVKEHLGIEPSEDVSDSRLKSLITSASSLFKTATRRAILYQPSIVETRDGQGTSGISPREYPVKSVASVVVDGTTIDARTTANAGWVLDDDRIEIAEPLGSLAAVTPFSPFPPYSPAFTIGKANVVLTYAAGYLAAESVTSATAGVQTAERFVADYGVTKASDGTSLTKVSGTPITGQYAVNSLGLYTFGDAGVAVVLSYSYVPADVEQAVIDMVAWQFRARDRVGQTSKVVGGETVGYSQAEIPPSAQMVIDKYQRWDL